jgi:hypothetical protein
MKETILGLIIAVTFICSACGGDPVIGLWETTTTREQVIVQPGEWDGRERMRLKANGEFSWGFVTSGRWRRLDDKRIRVDVVELALPRDRSYQKTFIIEINGNRMTRTDEEDGTVTYMRRVE